MGSLTEHRRKFDSSEKDSWLEFDQPPPGGNLSGCNYWTIERRTELPPHVSRYFSFQYHAQLALVLPVVMKVPVWISTLTLSSACTKRDIMEKLVISVSYICDFCSCVFVEFVKVKINTFTHIK